MPPGDRRAYIPERLLLQWHITDLCNLRCAHCYQDQFGRTCDLPSLLIVLEQYKNMLRVFRRRSPAPVRGHVSVTGGEPFMHRQLFSLLRLLADNAGLFSFSILTNGALIDRQAARELAGLGAAFVQVSLEGDRTAHDSIRGQGSFEKACAGIQQLVRHKIATSISFTASRKNYTRFARVVKVGRRLGVDRIWADRYIPLGHERSFHRNVMTPEETRRFFQIMEKAGKCRLFSKTRINMHRALQFLVHGGKPYACQAGDSLVAVMPNGDLYPCRRMPVCVGNLFQTPLIRLYYQSSLFDRLRARPVVEGCKDCFYARLCQGGLKCLSYAIHKTPFQADPGCWEAAASVPRLTDFDGKKS